MVKLLKEPLLHFLVLGVALFALFGWKGNDEASPAVDEIVVTPGRIEQLISGFLKTWQRPPTEPELIGLINEFVREEIFYREALAMGRDKDDTIVRRRMQQKLEFITEDIMALPEPTEEDLTAYLQNHIDAFRFDDELSFNHVFLNPDTRGEALGADADVLLAQLSQDAGIDTSMVGDRFMLGYEFETATAFEIEKAFGKSFATELLKQPVQKWSGPVESGYGMHLIYIEQKVQARHPTLKEVRAEVMQEWQAAKRKEMNKAFYDKLSERYVITIERAEVEK